MIKRLCGLAEVVGGEKVGGRGGGGVLRDVCGVGLRD